MGGTDHYSFEDTKKNTKYFQWLTETECKNLPHPVRLRAPKSTGAISGLVQAPIAIDEVALKNFLSSRGVDVAKFGEAGTKSLSEFADELTTSESSLAITDSGQVVRVVDMVTLVLTRADKGKQAILIEAKEKTSKGEENKLDRLPGSKILFQETPFQAVYRLLERALQIDQNCVDLNDKTLRLIEKTKDSPSYPGLQTLYKKRVVTGELTGKA